MKIAYLEAGGGGVSIIVMDNENHQVNLTLTKFLSLLPNNFIRISKTNLINISRIQTINRGDRTVLISCQPKARSLSVSDTYYSSLLDALPMAKDQINKS